MVTEKKSSSKTSKKKAPVKKSAVKKPSSSKRVAQKSKESQLSFTLDIEGRLTIDRLKKWTRFVGIMNIVIGIIYCFTIIIFSIPTVLIGIVTLFIVALVFMLFLFIIISLFASVFIEFWNSQNFNYSISLIN